MNSETMFGRIAYRQEGNNWNCYFAQPGTMDGAMFLGTLSMNIARHPKYRQAFINLMREVVTDLLQSNLGFRPEWTEPHAAPEHERSGNA